MHQNDTFALCFILSDPDTYPEEKMEPDPQQLRKRFNI